MDFPSKENVVPDRPLLNPFQVIHIVETEILLLEGNASPSRHLENHFGETLLVNQEILDWKVTFLAPFQKILWARMKILG